MENKSENQEKGVEMSDVTTESIRTRMQAIVREAAAPAEVGESVKAAIRRASMTLRMPFGRVKRHWYGEARMVSAAEYINAQLRIEARRKAEAGRLRAQLKILESQYAADREGFLHDASPLVARLVPPAVGKGETGDG